jgi:peptidoglycan/xylan/chitin deacetylase (PgdA/CDA1 family)
VRFSPTVVAALGAGAVGTALLAGNAAPSLLALSSVGRRVSPRLAGVGAPGHVALTFDDGPDPESTPEFVRVLDRLGWHATFFMLGDMVRRAPSLAAEVAAAGHEIAVHGDMHRSQVRLRPRTVADDVARARDAIAGTTGVEPTGLRAARAEGLTTVLWTAWGRDWRPEATGATVAVDVLGGYVDGGTVLLHDSDCTSAPGSWRAALAALPVLADAWAGSRLSVGPLGEHGIVRAHPLAA